MNPFNVFDGFRSANPPGGANIRREGPLLKKTVSGCGVQAGPSGRHSAGRPSYLRSHSSQSGADSAAFFPGCRRVGFNPNFILAQVERIVGICGFGIWITEEIVIELRQPGRKGL